MGVWVTGPPQSTNWGGWVLQPFPATWFGILCLILEIWRYNDVHKETVKFGSITEIILWNNSLEDAFHVEYHLSFQATLPKLYTYQLLDLFHSAAAGVREDTSNCTQHGHYVSPCWVRHFSLGGPCGHRPNQRWPKHGALRGHQISNMLPVKLFQVALGTSGEHRSVQS